MHEELKENKKQAVFDIELDKIKPNPFQPRINFDGPQLESLANSIKQYGVLQPIVVTRKEKYEEGVGLTSEYEIIAGERRFRASKLAGLDKIPAIIRENDHTDKEKLELAIIENLQREDLNPIDRAKAFKKLAETFDLKHVDIAIKLGKSREYISNSMRLLMLPEEIQQAVIDKKITEGHTRPLLMLKDRPEEQHILFKKIMLNKLTVRAAERLAREIATDKIRKPLFVDAEIKEAEKKLAEKLGTKVSIEQKDINGPGKITIEYFSKEELQAILQAIKDEEKRQIKIETKIVNSSNSLYDAFLKSKNNIERRDDFTKERGKEEIVDKSINQKIDQVNNLNFNINDLSTTEEEPDILKLGGEIPTEEVKIDSVVSGSDFLAAKSENNLLEDTEEEKTEQKNTYDPDEEYGFKGFSI